MKLAEQCDVTRRYHVAEGVTSFLDDLDIEGLFTEFNEPDEDMLPSPEGTAVYEVKVEFHRQEPRIISGTYDKQGLPKDWPEFIEDLYRFISFYGFGEMFDEKQYAKTYRKKNDYINNYYPFLTSLGMDVLLVIENRSKVVLVKRSKQLINMKEDQWHLSMNEAISITDLAFGRIDLEGCVRRGFLEELGLDCNKANQVNLYFSDIFLLKNPLEIGILAFVTMDELTECDVRKGYNFAQDATLESTGDDETGLKFLKFSEKTIVDFCKKENVTSAAKYALKMLCIRRNQL